MPPNHVCNAFCRDGVHCTCVLADPRSTADTLGHHYREKYGTQFLRVIPAREADVTEWRRRERWSAPVQPHHTTPWLLFFQRIP